MLSLKAAELKFLLKLLGCEGYHGNITALSGSGKTSARECDRICESLSSKGLVEYDSEVARFRLAQPGKTLLTLDTTSLPITPDELKVLKACKNSMTPSKLSVPAASRQQLIHGLAKRKMLTITKSTITEVRLTAQGAQFLRDDYEPIGHSPAVSATLLGYYVKFLRATLGAPSLK
jgi:predicted transcriptional regulator